MKLKQTIRLIFLTVFSIVTLSSCDDNEYTTTGLSADAQIYTFQLAAIATNAIDSANYPIMKKTKFAIDQSRQLIYNPDSLPYQTALKKFAATITYGSSSPSRLQLVYPDSVSTWNGSDSIDFSLHPKIRVTATNGTSNREYTIDIRIHQVDPDTLTWNNVANQPNTVGRQKTLLKGNTFHTFSIDSDGKLYLYKASKSNVSDWAKQAVTSIPAASVVLESITLFNDTFFAVDNNKNAYSSTDGVAWSAKSANVLSIIGILPEAAADKDSLLVITEDAGKYYFAKTKDISTLKVVNKISYNPLSNEVPATFPASGFSAVTIVNRSNLNGNILTTVGGKTLSNQQTNLSWAVRAGDNRLEIISSQENFAFAANAGIASFWYNEYMYALTDNTLYRSISVGSKWAQVPSKESIDPNMPKAYGQSIIVDDENYIWIFGGISEAGATPVRQIWRGRLNKLIP
ncbi:MAG: DUF6242 domain-containing protein [Prevotella sp.]|jgi:hypothetical protein|nr:DUF6242 domain-containing protein [Prevotella sp.]